MNENGELQYERFTIKTRIIRFIRNLEPANVLWLIRDKLK